MAQQKGIYFLSPTSDAFRLLKKRFVTVVLLDSITIKRNEFSLIAFHEVEEESTRHKVYNGCRNMS